MLKSMIFAIITAFSLFVTAHGRDNIQIVGSSTVFPFSAQVAENFTKTSSFPAPVVESTGSGGGLKLFCSGLGEQYPDITNASRKIKQSEIDLCRENGVTEIVEVTIGYDGIVLGQSQKTPAFNLSRDELFAALAAQLPNESGELQPNPNKKWSDINPDLPDFAIKIYGPPPTSGTRDAFLELAMEVGAKSYDTIKALPKKEFKAVAHSLREDGVFIEAGENDNLIINKLTSDPEALGLFGYSFLEENADKVRGISIDGVVPEFDAIADGDYALARPLFFYVKKQHIGTIAGIAEFLAEFTSDRAIGEDGYLSDKGLIPLPDELKETSTTNANNLQTLD